MKFEIWLNGIRFDDIADEINRVEALHLKDIAVKLLNEKTSHLKEKIQNEAGTLLIILTEENISYQFEGFSSELTSELKAAMSTN